MNTLVVILIFLFIVAIVATIFNYRIALCLFPDGVKVTRLQGFLAWYGWLNLFVALPFLWDGDLANGIYPLCIGLVPTLYAIYSVFKSNDIQNISYDKDAKVYVKSDKELVEPGNNIYGFLNNYSRRIRIIGPKFFFKELFARERANKALAECLLEKSPEETADTLRSLPWVIDKAVDVKAQFVFLLEYMTSRYNQEKLIENYADFAANSIAVAKLLDMTFDKFPYPLAKYIAQNDILVSLENKDESDFVIESDKYVCDDDEIVIAIFTQNIYHINENCNNLIKPILQKYYKLTAKEQGTIIITNKNILLNTYEQKTLPLSSELYVENADVSFDKQTYFCVKETKYLKFILSSVTKIN